MAYNRRTLAFSLTAFVTMKGRDTMPASGISTPRLQRITDMLHTYLDDKKLAGMNALVSYRGQVAYKTCLGIMYILNLLAVTYR